MTHREDCCYLSIEAIHADVAAISEVNHPLPKFGAKVINRGAICGWSTPSDPIRNRGVVAVESSSPGFSQRNGAPNRLGLMDRSPQMRHCIYPFLLATDAQPVGKLGQAIGR
jgi:hypothetical protein